MLRNCWEIASPCDFSLTAPGIVHCLENFSNVFPQFGLNSEAPRHSVVESRSVPLPRHFCDTFSGKAKGKKLKLVFFCIFDIGYLDSIWDTTIAESAFIETFWCSSDVESCGLYLQMQIAGEREVMCLQISCKSTGFISLLPSRTIEWSELMTKVKFLRHTAPCLAPSLTPSNPRSESKGRLGVRVREERETYLRGEAGTGQMRGDKWLISRGLPNYSIPYYLWSKDANRIEIEYKQSWK